MSRRISKAFLSQVFCCSLLFSNAPASIVPAEAAEGPSASCLFTADYRVAADYGCVATNFDRYWNQAQHGDKIAADILYYALNGCKNTQMKRRVAALASIESDPSKNVGSGHLETILKSNDEKCIHFDDNQRSRYAEVIWFAAENGNERALWNLYSEVKADVLKNGDREGKVDKLMALLTRNADADHEQNLLILAAVFSEGLMVPQDLIQAYAYEAAAVAVTHQAGGLQMSADLLTKLDRIGEKLTSEQKSEAMSRMANLLRTSPTAS